MQFLNKHKKTIFGLALSAAAIYYIYRRVDPRMFVSMDQGLNPAYLPLILLLWVGTFIGYSYRWYVINEEKGTYWTSFKATILAIGGNALLPARGGDVMRLLYFKKKAGQPVTIAAVRALLEKGLDLPILLSTVAVTFSVFQSDPRILFVPTAMLLAIAGILTLVAVKPEYLKWAICRGAKILQRFSTEKKQEEITESENFFPTGPYLLKSFGATVLMWYVPVLAFYTSFLLLFGLDLSIKSGLIIMLFAALGVSIPSAPSGIGVYHAAVASAFELMGLPIEKGLYYATIIHAIVFVPAAISTLVIHFTDRDSARA